VEPATGSDGLIRRSYSSFQTTKNEMMLGPSTPHSCGMRDPSPAAQDDIDTVWKHSEIATGRAGRPSRRQMGVPWPVSRVPALRCREGLA